VTGFGRISEICEKYLDQGDRVGVAGSLSQDKWESETGEKRSSYKIIAHSIEFIKVKKKVEEGKGEDDIPF
jgi:single-strand DNA-binding protein